MADRSENFHAMTRLYETIIGLEIHLQLKTLSKMFCSCANMSGESAPNTSVCPICMGHPGTLPTINHEAVKQGIRMALALQCTIAPRTRFDRKNYFYPDLPKGYQISQYDQPLATGGHLNILIDGTVKHYSLERLHLEEDAAKNFHRDKETLIDFNRAGTPLAEIVTKADFRSPQETRGFLQELQLIARYLDSSDADMEKGHLRCDANISLRPGGDEKLYPKIEVKNLNSFKSVERALDYEVQRQTKLWDEGKQPIVQETRGWDENKGITVLQRRKEESEDYRYFPEPDLPAVVIRANDIEDIKSSLPELPEQKRQRFIKQYFLSYAEAFQLIVDKSIATFFEDTVSELHQYVLDELTGSEQEKDAEWHTRKQRMMKLVYSWITSEMFKHMNSDGRRITDIPITPLMMAEFIFMVYEARVNSSAAQTILEIMYRTGTHAHEVVEQENLLQTNDETEIRQLVIETLAKFPAQVEQFKKGKQGVLQYLIGQVMKASHGKANPTVASKLIDEVLK